VELEHRVYVGRARSDAACDEPRRQRAPNELGQAGPVDDLEQHLDLELRCRGNDGRERTTTLQLGGRTSALDRNVNVLVTDRLTPELLALDELEERVVHAHPEPRL